MATRLFLHAVCATLVLTTAPARATDALLQSTNSGPVSVVGSFSGEDGLGGILGGRDNAFSISATGASVQLTSAQREGGAVVAGSALESTNDGRLQFGSLEASVQNSGDVSATGSFSGLTISRSGNRNSMSVRAVGASLTIEARSE
jgi:hypothetical protein